MGIKCLFPHQIIAKNLIIILHIMAHQYLALAVVHEFMQPFGARIPFAGAVDLEHGVDVASDGLGQFLVGLEDDIERLAYHLAFPHLNGGNLYNVVVLHIESCGLGIEYDQFLTIVDFDELLQV